MTRSIELSRDEAELLVDLLMLSDHHLAKDLDDSLRELFGMVSLKRQISAEADRLHANAAKWLFGPKNVK